VKLVKPLVEQVKNHPKIHDSSLIQSETEVTGFIGNFNVNLDEKGEETKFNVGTIVVAVGARAVETNRPIWLWQDDQCAYSTGARGADEERRTLGPERCHD
jgi:hypothetical protein